MRDLAGDPDFSGFRRKRRLEYVPTQKLPFSFS